MQAKNFEQKIGNFDLVYIAGLKIHASKVLEISEAELGIKGNENAFYLFSQLIFLGLISNKEDLREFYVRHSIQGLFKEQCAIPSSLPEIPEPCQGLIPLKYLLEVELNLPYAELCAIFQKIAPDSKNAISQLECRLKISDPILLLRELINKKIISDKNTLTALLRKHRLGGLASEVEALQKPNPPVVNRLVSQAVANNNEITLEAAPHRLSSLNPDLKNKFREILQEVPNATIELIGDRFLKLKINSANELFKNLDVERQIETATQIGNIYEVVLEDLFNKAKPNEQLIQEVMDEQSRCNINLKVPVRVEVANVSVNNSNAPPSNNEEQIMAVENEGPLSRYTDYLQAYIKGLRKQEKISDKIKGLQLNEQEEELFEKFNDYYTFECMDEPVKLHGQYYDFKNIPTMTRDHNNQPFLNSEVTDGRDLIEKLEKTIKKLEKNRSSNNTNNSANKLEVDNKANSPAPIPQSNPFISTIATSPITKEEKKPINSVYSATIHAAIPAPSKEVAVSTSSSVSDKTNSSTSLVSTPQTFFSEPKVLVLSDNLFVRDDFVPVFKMIHEDTVIQMAEELLGKSICHPLTLLKALDHGHDRYSEKQLYEKFEHYGLKGLWNLKRSAQSTSSNKYNNISKNMQDQFCQKLNEKTIKAIANFYFNKDFKNCSGLVRAIDNCGDVTLGKIIEDFDLDGVYQSLCPQPSGTYTLANMRLLVPIFTTIPHATVEVIAYLDLHKTILHPLTLLKALLTKRSYTEEELCELFKKHQMGALWDIRRSLQTNSSQASVYDNLSKQVKEHVLNNLYEDTIGMIADFYFGEDIKSGLVLESRIERSAISLNTIINDFDLHDNFAPYCSSTGTLRY